MQVRCHVDEVHTCGPEDNKRKPRRRAQRVLACSSPPFLPSLPTSRVRGVEASQYSQSMAQSQESFPIASPFAESSLKRSPGGLESGRFASRAGWLCFLRAVERRENSKIMISKACTFPTPLSGCHPSLNTS